MPRARLGIIFNMTEIDKEATKIIEENPVAFATVDPSSGTAKPNVIGVAYVKVVDKDKVLITDNYMKQTLENLKQNNNVCLAVWDKDWQGYKLIGTSEYQTEGKWFDYIKRMPENKGLPAKGAILITVSKIIKLG